MHDITKALRLPLLLVATFALAACQQTATSVGEGIGSAVQSTARMFEDEPEPEISMMSIIEARLNGGDLDALVESQPEKAPAAQCDANKTIPDGTFEESAELVRLTSTGTWPIPVYEQYLTETLELIIACTPAAPLATKIQIAPRSNNHIAMTMLDGMIVVNLATLKDLNHKETMFLLAHEYGHLLLGHLSDVESSNTRNRIMSLVTESAFLADDVLRGADQEPTLADKLKSPRLMRQTADLLFFQPLTRLQEHEADMFALHVLQTMGVDITLDLQTFFALIAQQKPLADQLEDLAEEKKKTLGAQMARRGLAEGKDGLMAEIGELGTEFGQTIVTSLSNSHPTNEERVTILQTYMDTHGLLFGYTASDYVKGRMAELEALHARAQSDSVYKTAAAVLETSKEIETTVEELKQNVSTTVTGDLLDALVPKGRQVVSGPVNWFDSNSVGRHAFAGIRLAQGDYNRAEIGLKRAIKAEAPPLSTFEELMNVQILAKKLDDADATLQAAAEEFGEENPYLYPLRVTLISAQGENPQPILSRCRLSAPPAVAQKCRYLSWDSTSGDQTGESFLKGLFTQ